MAKRKLRVNTSDEVEPTVDDAGKDEGSQEPSTPVALRRQPLAQADTPEACQAPLPSRRVVPRGGMMLRSGFEVLWPKRGLASSASTPELSQVSATSGSSFARDKPSQDTKSAKSLSAGDLIHEAHNETASLVSTSTSSGDVSRDDRDGGVATSAASASPGVATSTASCNTISGRSDPFSTFPSAVTWWHRGSGSGAQMPVVAAETSEALVPVPPAAPLAVAPAVALVAAALVAATLAAELLLLAAIGALVAPSRARRPARAAAAAAVEAVVQPPHVLPLSRNEALHMLQLVPEGILRCHIRVEFGPIAGRCSGIDGSKSGLHVCFQTGELVVSTIEMEQDDVSFSEHTIMRIVDKYAAEGKATFIIPGGVVFVHRFKTRGLLEALLTALRP